MNDVTRCCSFLDSQNYFVQTGAVVLKFGKNFVCRSEIADF